MWFLSIPLFMLSSLVFPAIAFTQELSCPDLPGISVDSANHEETAVICQSAKKALEFLAGFNLTPKRKIHFTVIDKTIDNHGYEAYGSYDSRSDRIQLMSYTSILNGKNTPQMYGESFDRVHYTGAIAHEIAHAVVQHNLKFKPISPGPQEYLAYATQLAVLPTERRAAIIKAMAVKPWESGDAISDVYLAIEPGKFAVKSYLHLTGLSEPSTFIDILLNSKWFYVYVP